MHDNNGTYTGFTGCETDEYPTWSSPLGDEQWNHAELPHRAGAWYREGGTADQSLRWKGEETYIWAGFQCPFHMLFSELYCFYGRKQAIFWISIKFDTSWLPQSIPNILRNSIPDIVLAASTACKMVFVVVSSIYSWLSFEYIIVKLFKIFKVLFTMYYRRWMCPLSMRLHSRGS